MERKIGEIFEDNGEWYQCIRSITCINCGFNNKGCLADRHITGDCSGRLDGESVVFKKLEKVGKPFITNGKKYQRYVTHVHPYILNELNSMPIDDSIALIEIKQNKEDMEEYEMHDAREDIPEFDKVVDECLFGEDKPNLKPFNLEAAKAGKPVCTRDGRKARIICFDKKDCKRIVALVQVNNETEVLYDYYNNGSVFHSDSDNDLMMLPEKKEGWVNVYNSHGVVTFSHNPYDTKEEAMKDKGKYYVDTIKVEWKE